MLLQTAKSSALCVIAVVALSFFVSDSLAADLTFGEKTANSVLGTSFAFTSRNYRDREAQSISHTTSDFITYVEFIDQKENNEAVLDVRSVSPFGRRFIYIRLFRSLSSFDYIVNIYVEPPTARNYESGLLAADSLPILEQIITLDDVPRNSIAFELDVSLDFVRLTDLTDGYGRAIDSVFNNGTHLSVTVDTDDFEHDLHYRLEMFGKRLPSVRSTFGLMRPDSVLLVTELVRQTTNVAYLVLRIGRRIDRVEMLNENGNAFALTHISGLNSYDLWLRFLSDDRLAHELAFEVKVFGQGFEVLPMN